MPTDVLSYRGDAGLGSNPQIPAISTNDNLKVISDTSRDIMLLDSERNMRLFNQKVKDRDQLTSLILQNQVSTKNIDAQYLPQFLDVKKQSEDAFDKWRGNPNDIEGFKKYQDAITHLQDYAAHAQTNTTELQKLQQQRAGETLPWKQKALDKWIGDQQAKTKKDPWESIDPYQNMFSFSIDPINKLYKTATTPIESPDGLWKSDVTYGDYNATLKSAQNEYLNNGETSEDMRQFLHNVEAYDPAQKKKFVDAINSQLQKYNQERGLIPGQPEYAESIDLVPGPDNVTHIKAPPQEFAAKYALAQQEKYVTQGPKLFQKDFGTFQLGKERNEIAAKKLGVESAKAGAYIRNLDAKTNKFLSENKDQATDVIKEYNDFVDNINPGGIILTNKQTKKKTGELDAVFLDELPGNYQYINGPMVAMKTTTDKKGNVTSVPTGKIEVGKLEPFTDTKNRPYYIPKYVNAKTGEKIKLDSDFIKDTYRDWKKQGFVGTADDMFRTLLKNGALEMVLSGKNGTANYTSMYQSAKTMNATGGKKGGENIVNAPDEEPDSIDEE